MSIYSNCDIDTTLNENNDIFKINKQSQQQNPNAQYFYNLQNINFDSMTNNYDQNQFQIQKNSYNDIPHDINNMDVKPDNNYNKYTLLQQNKYDNHFNKGVGIDTNGFNQSNNYSYPSDIYQQQLKNPNHDQQQDIYNKGTMEAQQYKKNINNTNLNNVSNNQSNVNKFLLPNISFSPYTINNKQQGNSELAIQLPSMKLLKASYTMALPNDFEGLLYIIQGNVSNNDEYISDAIERIYYSVCERYDQLLLQVSSSMSKSARLSLSKSSWVTDIYLPSKLIPIIEKYHAHFATSIANDSIELQSLLDYLESNIDKFNIYVYLIQIIDVWIKCNKYLGIFEKTKNNNHKVKAMQWKSNKNIINTNPPPQAPRSVGRPKQVQVISIGDFVDSLVEPVNIHDVCKKDELNIVGMLEELLQKIIKYWSKSFSLLLKQKLITENLEADAFLNYDFEYAVINALKSAGNEQYSNETNANTLNVGGKATNNTSYIDKWEKIISNVDIFAKHNCVARYNQLISSMCRISYYLLSLTNNSRPLEECFINFYELNYTMTLNPFSVLPSSYKYVDITFVEILFQYAKDSTRPFPIKFSSCMITYIINILSSFGYFVSMRMFTSVSFEFSKILAKIMPERLDIPVDVPLASSAIYAIFIFIVQKKFNYSELNLNTEIRHKLYDSILYAAYGLSVIAGRINGEVTNIEAVKSYIENGDNIKDIALLNQIISVLPESIASAASEHLKFRNRVINPIEYKTSFTKNEVLIVLPPTYKSRNENNALFNNSNYLELHKDLLYLICSIFSQFSLVDDNFNNYIQKRSCIVHEIIWLSKQKYLADILNLQTEKNMFENNPKSDSYNIPEVLLY